MQEHHSVLHYDSALVTFFQNPRHSDHHGFMLSTEAVSASFCARTNAQLPNSLVLMTVPPIGQCLAFRVGTATVVLVTLFPSTRSVQ